MDDFAMHGIELFHGITSTLSPTNPPMSPLRRALSADMSSRNWVPRDPPKGPDHLLHTYDEDEQVEEEGERFEIWNSILEDKRKAMSNDLRREGFDVWGSITSRKEFRRSMSETLPPQYVHPLVRRSSSCLSERSLEICTESLGSETGSDGFSSSETRCLFGRPKEDEGGKSESFYSSAFGRTGSEHDVDAKISPQAPAATPRNKQGPRLFPPTLPSLSLAADGASLRMQSRRENGRLVLEAVSVPSQKNFQARRENGRLVLAVTTPDQSTGERDEGDDEAEEVAAEEGAGIELIIRKKTEEMGTIKKLNIPKVTIMMNKSDEVRKVVFFKGINEGEVAINSPVTNPLKVYEYFWRTIPGTTETTVTDTSETTTKQVAMKGYRSKKEEEDVQILISSKNMVKNCWWVSAMKDKSRRRRRSSLLFLEPRVIATS